MLVPWQSRKKMVNGKIERVSNEEKIIKKKDDWYNEDCWDNLYEELKVGKKDE